MEITKTCKVHGELSIKDIKTGVYRGRNYKKCRLCENERSQKYRKKRYSCEEERAKKQEADRKYWKENKDEIMKRRLEGTYNEKRRKAYKENIDMYRASCNEKQKVYRDTLHDSYIKKAIQDGDKTIPYSGITDGMVKLKRSVMLLRRGMKKCNTIEIKDRLK